MYIYMNMNADEHLTTDHVAVSRLLSKILRHEPEMIGIRLDSQGWVTAFGLPGSPAYIPVSIKTR